MHSLFLHQSSAKPMAINARIHPRPHLLPILPPISPQTTFSEPQHSLLRLMTQAHALPLLPPPLDLPFETPVARNRGHKRGQRDRSDGGKGERKGKWSGGKGDEGTGSGGDPGSGAKGSGSNGSDGGGSGTSGGSGSDPNKPGGGWTWKTWLKILEMFIGIIAFIVTSIVAFRSAKGAEDALKRANDMLPYVMIGVKQLRRAMEVFLKPLM